MGLLCSTALCPSRSLFRHKGARSPIAFISFPPGGDGSIYVNWKAWIGGVLCQYPPKKIPISMSSPKATSEKCVRTPSALVMVLQLQNQSRGPSSKKTATPSPSMWEFWSLAGFNRQAFSEAHSDQLTPICAQQLAGPLDLTPSLEQKNHLHKRPC